MTLYLGRKVVDGEVDETSTTYLGRCDEAGCRYLADHGLSEVVEDALDGHRRRAHATSGLRPEDATRTGWMMTFTGPVVTAGEPAGWGGDAPKWSPTSDPHLPPSPTPREEDR